MQAVNRDAVAPPRPVVVAAAAAACSESLPHQWDGEDDKRTTTDLPDENDGREDVADGEEGGESLCRFEPSRS